jgi:hypothetical protein
MTFTVTGTKYANIADYAVIFVYLVPFLFVLELLGFWKWEII